MIENYNDFSDLFKDKITKNLFLINEKVIKYILTYKNIFMIFYMIQRK